MTQIALSDVATAEPQTVSQLRTPLTVRPDVQSLPGTRSGWAMRSVYFLSDLLAFAGSLLFAQIAIDLVRGLGIAAIDVVELKLDALWLIGLLVVAAAQQTYAAIPPRPVRKFRGWVMGAITVCAAVVSASWLLRIGSLWTYLGLGIATVAAILGASFCRALCRIAFGKSGWWGTRLIVVGSDGLGHRAYEELAREPQWGLRPVGYVEEQMDKLAVAENWLGTIERLDELAAEFHVDWALVAARSFESEELSDLLCQASGRIKHWILLPPLARLPSIWMEACEAARRPALTVTNRLRQGWSMPLKRAFDLSVAASIALAILPMVAVIAVLIRIGSPGPIFYGQERIGRFGRRFKAWKFRTMLPNADAVLAQYLSENPHLAEEWKANHKLRHDPRVTWIGRVLRSTSLDELPQIWNVLVGEMSLVGPRPIVAAEIEKYGEFYEHYVQVLPGVTGLWQVSGRNNTTYDERVSLDVYYVQNWSLWLDIYILACTAKVVLLCEGAY